MCLIFRTSAASYSRFRENPSSKTSEGDMRSAFFAAYREDQCEHLKLFSPEIDKRLKEGPELVSANFVIPYPPGFPIMVPGQVINAETIEFMRKLDVKEIHGFSAALGFKVAESSGFCSPLRHRVRVPRMQQETASRSQRRLACR